MDFITEEKALELLSNYGYTGKRLKYYNEKVSAYALALAKEGFKSGGHTFMMEKYPSFEAAYANLNGHQMMIATDLAIALQEANLT